MNLTPEIRPEALDACVLALHRASRERSAETYQAHVLELLRGIVPFDYAVWSRAALEDGVVRLYSAFELDMPPGAIQAQLEMGDRDVLGALAFANLGRTVNASHAANLTGDPAVVDGLLRRFDLGHFLTTCLIDPFTALISSITLIRREVAPAFTEAERATKERLTPHLVEAYTAARLLRLLEWRGGEAPYPNAVALCNEGGLLEFVSQQFTDLIRREWPDWRGPRLPAELRLSVGEPVRRVLPAITLHAEPIAGAIAVRVRARLPVDDLSAREVEVARLSALGRSNKQIGQDLSLSPFTVRNHLDSVYRKLGVSKRSELGAILPELEDLADGRAA